MAQAAKPSNNAPSIKWFCVTLPCGTRRQRLYVDGRETPYFIDSAAVAAHRTEGCEHGLFGSGMSARGTAATLGSHRKVATLKHRAEQYAFDHPETAVSP